MRNSDKGRPSRRRSASASSSKRRPTPTPSDDSEDALWVNASAGDDSSIEQLVSTYKSVASFTAKASMGRGVGIAELEDEAMRALRQAVCLYDTKRETSFKAFASTLIQHELANLFREVSLQSPYERVESAKYEECRLILANSRGQRPTREEIYDELGWSRTKRANHEYSEQRRTFQRLQGMLDSTGELPGDTNAQRPSGKVDSAEQMATHDAELERLNFALSELDPVSRRVLTALYLRADGSTKAMIAKQLKMTLYRLNETEKTALQTLRTKMDEWNTPGSPELTDSNRRPSKEPMP